MDQTWTTNLQQSPPVARHDTSLTRTAPRLPASFSAPSKNPRKKWHCGAVAADERQATLLLAQVSQAHGGISHDPVRTAMERLSEHEIKAFYVRCSQEVTERKLDGADVMICSVGYDVLLKKHFSGNFDLLLAWSRAQYMRLRPGR